MDKREIEILVPVFLFLLVLITKIPSFSLPYYWDDFNYVIPAVDHVFKSEVTPFLWEYGLGHPPFFYLLGGLIFRIFGDSLIVSHLIIVIFSFLSIYFTYLIGKQLFNKRTAIIASLLLLFTPMFFSFSGLFNLEMPLTAFIIISLYFLIINKYLLYTLFASLAVLTKETAIGVVLTILFIKILKEKTKLKIALIYSVPILFFLLWIMLTKIHYGLFFNPIGTSIITINPIKNFFNLLIILKLIFFDNFRWIITSLFFIQFISFKKIKNFNKIKLSLLIALISFFIFLNIPNVFSKYSNLFPNIESYLSLVKNFSILFSLIIFIAVISIKDITKFIMDKELWELFILIIAFIGMHTLVTPVTPRYLLPIFPIIMLILAYSISNLFKNKSYLIMLMFIIILVTQFFGVSNKVGFTLENNLEYQDFIKVRQLGASYLETNYPKSTILTTFPLSLDLSHSYGKYVRKELNVITIDHYGGLVNKNYTQFLHPETIPKREIDLSQIDFYYYSPQEFPTKEVYDIKDKLNLTLIKRFEINNKSTEIYLVNK